MATCLASTSGDSLMASFITSVRADLDSPVTSNFGTRVSEYRSQAQRLAEETELDVEYFGRMRRVSKEVETAMTTLAKQLLAFGAIAKELAESWTARPDSERDSNAAAALLKMELFLRGEAELINGQIRNWCNNIIHPLDLLLAAPSELRSKAVDKACREYESKFGKVETEARRHARHSGYTRSQLTHGELAEQLCRERLVVQHELCKFLLGMDAFEDKRGPQLLRHVKELFRYQNEYYEDHIRTNDHFRRDLEKLEEQMALRNADRCQQRNALFEIKNQLESHGGLTRSSSTRRLTNRKDTFNRGSRLSAFGGDLSGGPSGTSIGMGYIAGTENDSFMDISASSPPSNTGNRILCGVLYKKSNKKLHKQWQKRKCRIQDGHFWLSHSDDALPPAKVNLAVSDCKPSSEDPRTFDLYCQARIYHLQAESELEAKKWVVALKEEITRLKTQMLTADVRHGVGAVKEVASPELDERNRCVKAVRRLPGNQQCADCCSTEDVQWLSNTGALVCIACSGVHRELGVHVSRMQSLDFDVISPIEFLVPLATGNALINRVYEYDETLCAHWKPRPGCTRADRQKFIQFKYRDRAYIQKVEDADALFCDATRELDIEKAYRALLSPNLTGLPFEAYGPFCQMVKRGGPLALPIAQLVVQLRIEMPGLESMLTECVNADRADILAVLLHSRSMTFPLQSLEVLAIKLGHKKIIEILQSRIAQNGDRSQLNRVSIPSILLDSVPDSGSLSRSSSSVSPMRRSLPEVNQEGHSQPVTVLMRNGTTIAVPGAPRRVSPRPNSVHRSVSPAERKRPHSAYAPHTSVFSLTKPPSSFKGSTFGKCSPEEPLQHSIQQALQQSDTASVVSLEARQNPGSEFSSSPGSVLNTQLFPHLPESSPSTSTSSSPQLALTQERARSNEVAVTTPMPYQPAAPRPQAQVASMSSHYSRAPGPVKLAAAKMSSYEGSSNSAEDVRFVSSVPSSPVPAVPTQPKPRLYHRSASEYNQALPNPGTVRSAREQRMSSAVPSGGGSLDSEVREGFSQKPAVNVPTQFSMASSSLSLDPIPLGNAPKKAENTYVKGPGRETEKLVSLAEKRERLTAAATATGEKRAALASGSNTIDSRVTSVNTPFSSFDSARASFMTPGERARLSNPRAVSGVSTTSEPRKIMSSDGAPLEKAPGFVKKPKCEKQVPPPVPPVAVKLKPPIPAPRRNVGMGEHLQKECVRRCRALYDCIADNPDELSFRQGDVIIISRERIAGENDTWMEGYLQNDPQRKGVFPVTFVTFQS